MMMKKLALLTGMICLAHIYIIAQDKWKYDFIVPDNGNFVQAIHAANNRPDKSKRFRIFLKPQYYRVHGDGNTITTTENGKTVSFPSPITTLTAPNTSICGDSWSTTQVENCPQHEGISITSTLFLNGADSTYIQDVELWSNFRNDPNAFANRAVALNEKNCRGNILKRVSLLSTQDTYYTNSGGTTYLEDCHISGTVDFICGGGTIYFNHCDIRLLPLGKSGSRDVITAAATENGRRYGYVFADCYIDGDESQDGCFHLGRPWKGAPRVTYLNCSMNVKPAPEGWCEMHGTVPSLFAEYNSTDGQFSPLDMNLRKTTFNDVNGNPVNVGYSPCLTADEAEEYTIDKVFGTWKPDKRAAQVRPPLLRAKGKVITWDDIPEAGCYAIFRDRKIIAFTTKTSYTIGSVYEGACYSVRCANWYGGLGEASPEVVYPFR